jgi:hypothetical protein
MRQHVSPQVLAQLQRDLLALLPHNPQYALGGCGSSPAGNAELSYSVGVDGVTAADSQLPLPALAASRGRLRGRAERTARLGARPPGTMPKPPAPVDPGAGRDARAGAGPPDRRRPGLRAAA